MIRDLEIDKEDFDAFVREKLQLAPEAPITEFHYALIEDKLANSSLDLESWLENRRNPPTPVTPKPDSKASQKPEPPKVDSKAPPKPELPKVDSIAPPKPELPKVDSKAPLKPEPPKVDSKAPLKPEPPKVDSKAPLKPEPPKVDSKAPQKPEGPKADSKAPLKLEAPKADSKAAKKPDAPKPARPAASRRTRGPAPQKVGFFKVIGGLISFIFLLAMVTYLVGWYLPFEFRESLAKEEWLKSVPPSVVEFALFRHQKEITPLSLERGSPTTQVFASKKAFRLTGKLELKSPAAETFALKVRILKGKTSKVSKTIRFPAGISEQEVFNEVLESGEYTVEIALDSFTAQSKLPGTMMLLVKY